MRALCLVVLLLAGCNPNATSAVCEGERIECPAPDTCGHWLPVCDGPELCYGGDPSRINLGEYPRGCVDGVPRCPDGREAYCGFVPDYQNNEDVPGCDTRPWCER